SSNGAQGTLTVSEGDQSPTAAVSLSVTELPLSATGMDILADAGVLWAGTLVTFTDPDPLADLDNYLATIDYGDNSFDVGEVQYDDSGSWSVQGSHSYHDPGNYPVTITIYDMGTSTVVNCEASVEPPMLFIVGDDAVENGMDGSFYFELTT